MGMNPFMKMHVFLCVLPATAVWSYRMDEFHRSSLKILDACKYLVDILHII